MVNQSMDVGSISSYIVCGTGDTIVHGISNLITALLIHCFSNITLHYYRLPVPKEVCKRPAMTK